jgi:predicted RNase H-like HicB family nuclease
MTKYEIILYWSDEDQAFIAEVPELAGCAADGVTRQEALANVETVIAEWLEPPGNLDGLSQNPRAGSCSPEGRCRFNGPLLFPAVTILPPTIVSSHCRVPGALASFALVLISCTQT